MSQPDIKTIIDADRMAYNARTKAAADLLAMLPEDADDATLNEAAFYQSEIAKQALQVSMWVGHLAGFVNSRVGVPNEKMSIIK